MAKQPPRTITIDVTREDIDEGVPKDLCRCAIARSVSRMFPDYNIEVAGGVITITHKNNTGLDWWEYKLTKKAENFIDVYDYANTEKRKEMKPRKLTLRMVSYDDES